MQKLCCLCKKTVDADNAPILTIAGFGNAKYLCEECSEQIEAVSYGRDTENISNTIDTVAAKITKNNIKDEAVLLAIGDILEEGKARAQKIENGEYDFSLDEIVGEKEKIPEELAETEEDKALDEKEARAKALFDSIFNWVAIGIISLAVIGFIVYMIFFK